MQDLLTKPTDTLSILGQRWSERDYNPRAAMTICQQHGTSDIIGRILAGRGITSADAGAFLAPTLRAHLPDPFHLKDMAKAANRIADAITNRESIAIFGDYDVDGATSSALLMRYFRSFGLEPLVHIPDRMKEGYGPNTPALLSLKERGAKLVITVDCGAMAFEPLKAAKDAGIDVIVADHHKGDVKMPEAFAIVNPNRFDETSPHKQLAAVGVVFLLLVAVNKVLREMNSKNSLSSPSPLTGALSSPSPLTGEGRGEGEATHSDRATGPLSLALSREGRGNEIELPDLMQWLDIVALGTICDVVPLTGANRALVTQGLKIMKGRQNAGINAAMEVARLAEAPDTYHAGFVIGPRINAGGRVGNPDLGVRLLTCTDPLEAKELAAQLDMFNQERKAIESLVLEEALLQAAMVPEHAPFILVASGGWHAGVIGVVAGRLKEKYHKPVAVVAIKDGVGKASARSVTGVDLGAAVVAAVHAGLLVGGGGHAMAAGFTVEEEKLNDLRAFLSARILPDFSKLPRERTVWIDGTVSLPGVTVELARQIEQLGPFGASHAQVRLAISRVRVVNANIVGDGHVRAIIADASSGLSSANLKAMAFRSAETPLGQLLLQARGRIMSLAGNIRINSWQGRETADFFIEDAKLETP